MTIYNTGIDDKEVMQAELRGGAVDFMRDMNDLKMKVAA